MLSLTSTAGLTFVDDAPLSERCVWTATDDSFSGGLTQSSNAWGNFDGDNVLSGCHALYDGREYTDFLAQVRISNPDNDGVGFTFGWKGANDHHVAFLIDDQWPRRPAAAGVRGPMMSMQRRNARPCRPLMNATNSCYDTYAYLTSDHNAGEQLGRGSEPMVRAWATIKSMNWKRLKTTTASSSPPWTT